MNYDESIELLTSTAKFKIKLGLERIEKVLYYLGNPQEKVKIIHIAGTNGKGSVCAILADILKCSGYKTGLYTSPHLIEYTERIRINGKEILKDEFSSEIKKICNISEKYNIELTEFEILTAAAFDYFANKKTDFAVIETGLGGRFDAANICKNPICSIITSISLEHTDLLGDTVEKIAFEKAGIIKQNSTVIISALNKGYKTIKQQTEKIGAKLISVENDAEILFKDGINYAIFNGKKYEFPLLGTYQQQNLALVFAAVEFLNCGKYLEQGLKNVKWRARLEYIKEKNMILDGMHNADAAFELKKSLDYYFKNQKRIFIYAVINTKDYVTIAKTLFNNDDEIYYYEFNHKNAVSYDEYKKNVPFLKNLKPFTYNVLNKKDLKIVTGSIYMLGEFIKKSL